MAEEIALDEQQEEDLILARELENLENG